MELRSAYLFYGDGDISTAEYKLLSILKIAMEEVELEQHRIKSNLEKLDDYRKLRRKIGKKKAQIKFLKKTILYTKNLWRIFISGLSLGVISIRH